MGDRVRLAQKQALFARLMAQLTLWIFDQGWELTLSDGGVTLQRKVELQDGTRVKAIDREHREGSLHYVRLAQDVNLFVDGEYITDGSHPAYQMIGRRWKGMDSLARWGGDFGDANHFSLAHDGKA
jgi:hypothetical protein